MASNAIRRRRQPPTLEKLVQKKLSKMGEEFLQQLQKHREASRARHPFAFAASAAFDDAIENVAGIRPLELHRRLHPQRQVRKAPNPGKHNQQVPPKKVTNRPTPENPFIDEELQRLKDVVDGKCRR